MHRVLALLLPALACAGCETPALIPDSIINSMGVTAYADATDPYPNITSGPQWEMVKRVTDRITAASLEDYDWEVKLLQSEQINAFALPGGKIAVYTGILDKVIQGNEDQLAAVIGHEIAHVTMEHGNKRVTRSIGVELAFSLFREASNAWLEDPTTRDAVMGGLGLGVQYGVDLPFGRSDETQADLVGLEYMVRAGYDPYEAPKLWAKMGALSPNRPPEWQSTHPDPDNRQQDLLDAIPRVQAKIQAERSGSSTQPGGR